MKKKSQVKKKPHPYKQELRRGEQKLAAELAGVSAKFVSMVMNGDKKSQNVIEKVKEVIENRKKLLGK